MLPFATPRRARLRAHDGLAAAAALIAVLALSASAGADTIASNNWAGYAAHQKHVSFKQVRATWVEPAATCATGENTYSSLWAGIGGYSLSSDAMEQMGTELDCNGDGTQALSAWYELVPAPSRTIHMTIHSGDVITSTVGVVGHTVTLKLVDSTHHETFTKTITDHTVDDSSAEWIAEAPSNCDSSGNCTTLPLANFGTATFADAAATTPPARRRRSPARCGRRRSCCSATCTPGRRSWQRRRPPTRPRRSSSAATARSSSSIPARRRRHPAPDPPAPGGLVYSAEFRVASGALPAASAARPAASRPAD